MLTQTKACVNDEREPSGVLNLAVWWYISHQQHNVLIVLKPRAEYYNRAASRVIMKDTH